MKFKLRIERRVIHVYDVDVEATDPQDAMDQVAEEGPSDTDEIKQLSRCLDEQVIRCEEIK